MTVFALMLSTAYEGDMILGVYSSEDAATDALEAFFLAHQPSDSELLEIREIQLDAAAQYHW
jgi:hypothetical protein